MEQVDKKKKPRFLCLHGYARSGSILEKEVKVWPQSVLQRMDLVFIDGPIRLPDAAGDPQRFNPPYFSWFDYTPTTTDSIDSYPNFDRYVAYIEDCMLKLGPFDGLLGFSQGSTMSAALPGMQEQGVTLNCVNKIKFAILMSGAKFGGTNVPAPEQAKIAFSSPIGIPSIHMSGEKESSFFKENAIELIEAYVDPFVIHHSGGHEVPNLDEEGLKVMFEFLDKIQPLVQNTECKSKNLINPLLILS